MAASDVLDRPLDDLKARFWIDPADERKADAALAQEGVWTGDHVHATPEGRKLWLNTTLRLMPNADGEPAGVVALIRDVSDRLRELEASGITERRLREALRVGGMGFLDWNLETNEMIWSEETFRMYGYEPNSFSPTIHSAMKLVPAEEVEFVKQHLDAVVRGDSDYDIEHHMVRPDGTVIAVHARGEVMRDKNGKPLRMLGTITDITARKRAQEERQRSHDLLQKILASLEEAVLVVDLDTQLILECNETAERMFCYPKTELLGHSTEKLCADVREFETYSREMQAAIRSAGYCRTSFQAKRRNGEVFPTELAVRFIRESGGREATVTIIRDISERVWAEAHRSQLESQLVQAQKMEAIGRLAGGIAHDFGNLLTVITGYASNVLEALPKSSPLHEDVGEILDAGQRAAALTQQLLAFGRKQVVEPKVIDLSQVVASTERMLQRLISENISVRIKLASAPVLILADSGQIEQVIFNLVINARDALEGGGTITVETDNVCLGEAETGDIDRFEPGSYGSLTISDTGVGMDTETLSRIFEPFFSTKNRAGGTGLGLATVYGIVRQSGGLIRVESRPGGGSVFKVFLPSADAPAEIRQPEERLPRRLRGNETILVVEDEREVRRLTCSALKRFGYKPHDAANAGEAFRILQTASDRIALMITDVVMPGMTGCQLAQMLLKTRPDMKVMYMSGHVDEVLSKHGVPKDDLNFIQKPFVPEKLVAKVRRMLDEPRQPTVL